MWSRGQHIQWRGIIQNQQPGEARHCICKPSRPDAAFKPGALPGHIHERHHNSKGMDDCRRVVFCDVLFSGSEVKCIFKTEVNTSVFERAPTSLKQPWNIIKGWTPQFTLFTWRWGTHTLTASLSVGSWKVYGKHTHAEGIVGLAKRNNVSEQAPSSTDTECWVSISQKKSNDKPF